MLTLERAADTRFEDVAVPIPADFALGSGDRLPEVEVRVRLFGNVEGPQVVALGGISAGRDVCGQSGWWRDTIVDHGGIDLSAYGLVGIDFAPLANRRVRISPRDQARLLIIVLDRLRVRSVHALVGASYGGLVGLAFAAIAPERIERLCVIAAAHRPAAQSLAWRGVQRRLVEYGARHDDAAGGLALARQLAMITYRSGAEFEARFGAGIEPDGRGAVDNYLENRGAAYAGTAAPQRWLSLSESIDRGFVDPADVRVPLTLAACIEDQLAPIEIIRELAERAPRLSGLHVFRSVYGHDAFLKEPAVIAAIIRECLEKPRHV